MNYINGILGFGPVGLRAHQTLSMLQWLWNRAIVHPNG